MTRRYNARPRLPAREATLPRSKRIFDLLSTRGEGEPVWVMLNHSVDEFYLFDRRSDGIGALEPTRNI